MYYPPRSSAEIDWVLQRNLRFLEDYLALDPDQPTEGERDSGSRQRTTRCAPCRVGRATRQTEDDIYALNASTRIYIDVRAAPVAEPDRVRIFRDAETARAFELVGIDERANGRLNADNDGRLVRASPADLREANRSYAILAPYLTGMPPSLRSLLWIVVVAREEAQYALHDLAFRVDRGECPRAG